MKSIFQSCVSVLCLVAYLVGATPVMGALVGLAGANDPSHELLVNETEDGARIVLHHRDAAAKGRSHELGWLCNNLVATCEESGEGDHVFQEHVSSSQRFENSQARPVGKAGIVAAVVVPPPAHGAKLVAGKGPRSQDVWATCHGPSARKLLLTVRLLL